MDSLGQSIISLRNEKVVGSIPTGGSITPRWAGCGDHHRAALVASVIDSVRSTAEELNPLSSLSTSLGFPYRCEPSSSATPRLWTLKAWVTHRLPTLAAGLASALLLARSGRLALSVRRTPLSQLLVLG